jgi:arylsulfatase A-like enzyme
MRVLLDSLTAFVLSAVVSVAETKPNIVVINVDDLGWRDIEYLPEHDSLYPSPNIKQLAESGVVFTNAYAACPVCSPSRASLVTGKSPAALRLTAHIPGRPVNIAKKTPKESKWQPARSLNYLPLEEVTFAEVAKDNGYRTAFVGKWHLAGAGSVEQPEKRGAIAPEFHPDKQGFDVNLGGCAYGQPAKGYFDPHFNATLRDRKKGEYLTDRLTDEAVQWIEKQSDAPFLLYLNYYSVHTPIQAPADRVQLMRERGMSAKKAKYAAMV